MWSESMDECVRERFFTMVLSCAGFATDVSEPQTLQSSEDFFSQGFGLKAFLHNVLFGRFF